jgi:hypothetical protein
MGNIVRSRGEDEVGVKSVPFEAEIELPDGYQHLSQAAPALKYPIELVAAANYDLPVTGASGTPPTEWSAWPLVEQMPEDGLIFWLLRGDVAFDYEKMPDAGDWFDPQAYVFLGGAASGASESAPAGGVASRQAPFGMGDIMGSPWMNASVWARLIPLATAEGEISNEPPYLSAYCFTGKGSPPTDDANAILGSLAVNYSDA